MATHARHRSVTLVPRPLHAALGCALLLAPAAAIAAPADPACRCSDPFAPSEIEGEPACQFEAPTTPFATRVAWSFPQAGMSFPESDQTICTPLVVDLDGVDAPEVVLVTFPTVGHLDGNSVGVLRALDGVTGAERWSVMGQAAEITGNGGVAAGDLEGDGDVEIVVCARDQSLLAFDHEGDELWRAPGVCTSYLRDDLPALHDLDGDGLAEIVVGASVVSHAGAVLLTGQAGRGSEIYNAFPFYVYGATSYGADVDGDGALEIVAGNTVYDYADADADGRLDVRWSANIADGATAITDFEGDGVADLVLVGYGGIYRLRADTGAIVWGPIANPGGGVGGPPTVGDFDGDGDLEIGVSGMTQYSVLHDDGSILWQSPMTENSGALVGSALFDFEGDGHPDVVVTGQDDLLVLDGRSGAVRFRDTGHVASTHYEYPVVADIDADGEAELLTISNDYSPLYGPGRRGLTVFESVDGGWTGTGRVWNQYAFHRDHVEEDGRIPAAPTPSWQTHRTFRAAPVVGRPVHVAPDLGARLRACTATCGEGIVSVGLEVVNTGFADAAGVGVALYDATGALLFGATVAEVPGAGAVVADTLVVSRATFAAGDLRLVVDPDDAVEECDEDDNAATLAWTCTPGVDAPASCGASEPAPCACDGVPSPGAAVPIDATCQTEAPTTAFATRIAWSFPTADSAYPGYIQADSPPMVVELNGDGVPDVLLMTFPTVGHADGRSGGILRAFDGATGVEHWAVPGTTVAITGIGGLAAADLEGDGDVEIVVCARDAGLSAFDHEGVEIWHTLDVCRSWGAEDQPAIHDLDADGLAEIIVGATVLAHDGQVLMRGDQGIGSIVSTIVWNAQSFAADVDLDGALEIVAGRTVYEYADTNADGLLDVRWNAPIADGVPAIADFERDGVPDLIVVTYAGIYRLRADTGAVVWGPLANPGGGTGGGPTIADFDGDGLPEAGVVGTSKYSVLRGDGSVLWQQAMTENSGASASSTVFDFEGDGHADVVVTGQDDVLVLDGRSGAVKFRDSEHVSSTHYEYPVVADVDADGEAELLAVSNNYFAPLGPGRAGLTVWESADGRWAGTASIWNQHAFHRSHVDADGGVPAEYPPSWTTHNTFRAAPVVGLPTYGQPDLAARILSCTTTCGDGVVSVRPEVANYGAADAEAVTVALEDGAGALLFGATLARVAAGEAIALDALELAADAFTGGPLRLVVATAGGIAECDDGDNVATLAWQCRPDVETPATCLDADMPDLAISKAGPATAAPGEEVTYTLGLTNSGDAASGAVITDTLPDGMALVSAEPPPTAIDGQRLTWDVGAGPRACAVPAADGPIDPSCRVEPVVAPFDAVVEWQLGTWTEHPNHDQSATAPILAQVNDDNDDGAIDERDVPDLLTVFWPRTGDGWAAGVIRAISGDGSKTHWTYRDDSIKRGTSLAAADIDGDGLVEIVTKTNNTNDASSTQGMVLALEHDGTFKWESAPIAIAHVGAYDSAVSVSDMDGDGAPEIILGRAILSATGTLVATGAHGIGTSTHSNNRSAMSFAVDLDGDGQQEVVVGNALYRKDGAAIWHNGLSDGFPAVADLDGDGTPEIVVVVDGGIRVQRASDGAAIWSDTVTGRIGGPPTIADMDGDGLPEIGVAFKDRYVVFEGDGSERFEHVTDDSSSGATGSTVYDFEGDGVAEIVYADEDRLWVFALVAQANGTRALQPKFEYLPHESGTRFEYPIVADVDGDGAAEIAFVMERESGTGINLPHGVVVLGAAPGTRWRPARKIWNQHAYHITNVADDGSIPPTPERNWLSFNSFRSGDLGVGDGLASPNLTITAAPPCDAGCDGGAIGGWFQVANTGGSPLTAGAVVEVWATPASGGPEALAATLPLPEVIPAGRVLPARAASLPEDSAALRLVVVAGELECDTADNTLVVTPAAAEVSPLCAALAEDGEATISVVARTPSACDAIGDEVTNNATILSLSGDATPEDDAASSALAIVGSAACEASLVAGKSAAVLTAEGSADTSGVADVGDRVRYTVTVTNDGPADARAVVVEDTFPAGTAWAAGSLTIDGAPTPDDDDRVDPTALAGGRLELALGVLAADVTARVVFDLVVVDAPVGVTLTNVATATGLDPTGAERTATTPPATTPLCGNGLPEAGEGCDDGDRVDVDACTNTCAVGAWDEVCDDGWDNDGDGLVDGWDVDDCGATPSCTVAAPAPAFSVRQAWVSDFTLGDLQPVTVGDLDGDGLPEVVGAGLASGGEYDFTTVVIVHHAGTPEAEVVTAALPAGEHAVGGTSLAIGELFGGELVDGSAGAEIALLAASGRVHVLSADGVVLASSAPIHPALPGRVEGDAGSAPMLVDLEGDGTAEIVIGNAVVAVEAGGLVVRVPLDTTLPRGNVPNGNQPALADLLGIGDCGAPCAGPELAAGGTVYALDGDRRVVVARLWDQDETLPASLDGPTAIADMDGDGDLDVVFVDSSSTAGGGTLHIWDPSGQSAPARFEGAAERGGTAACWGGSAQARGLAGALAIAEIYDERGAGHDDNLPEVFFTTVDAVRAYNVQAGRVWSLAHSDCSAVTGVTAFDFNGDGATEVVINDQQSLRIIYGGALPMPAGVDAATRNWAAFTPSATATLTEHPIVVDVDADGAAEIVAVTGSSAQAINGRLRIFRSAGEPWQPARTVWTQRGYHPGAIGEDLVVPTEAQSPLAELPPGSGRTPLALWNAQVPPAEALALPAGRVPAADIRIVSATLTSADPTTGVSRCGEGDHVNTIALVLDNVGDAALPAGRPIAVYLADPFASAAPTLVGVAGLAVGVGRGERVATTIVVDDAGLLVDHRLWIVVNDAGEGPFPRASGAGAGECVVDAGGNGAAVDVVCSDCGNGVVEVGEACDGGPGAGLEGADPCACTAGCVYPGEQTACDDGLFCTVVSRCDGAGACGVTAVSGGNSPCEEERLCDEDADGCDACLVVGDCEGDAGECRAWTCVDPDGDGLSACVAAQVPAGAACTDDGVYCNGAEACDAAGACVSGPAPCVAARCDELEDTCAAPGCGDGILDPGEACDAGSGAGGNGTTACGCSVSCVYPSGPAACDDGLFCTVLGACDGAGACVAGGRSETNTPCAADRLCDEAVNGCDGCLVAADCQGDAGVCRVWACADGDADGLSTCGPALAEAGAACASDDLYCSGPESCDASGACVSGPAPCIAARCDEATDTCAAPRCGDGVVDAGEACDDGDGEAGNGSTACGCGDDCAYPSGPAACDDGLWCTTLGACDGAGACEAGARSDRNSPCARDALCDEAADMCRACEAGRDCYCDLNPADEPCNPGCVGSGCFCAAEPEHGSCDLCDAGATCGACVPGVDCYCDLRPDAPGCLGCTGGACPCDDPARLGDDDCPTCVPGVDCACDREPEGVACQGAACVAGQDCWCDRHGDDLFCGACEGPGCYCDVYPDAPGCSGCEGDACACADPARLGTPECPLCTSEASCFCELHPDRPGCRDCRPGVDCLCDAPHRQDEPPCDPRCASDDDCDNGAFCDGVERCVDSACVVGEDACAPPTTCDEATDTCVEPPRCGDGTVDEGEACDDGDNDDGDGCSAACEVEVEDGLFAEGGGGCGAGRSGAGGALFVMGVALLALARRRGARRA